MRILILGATGLIGAAVAALLRTEHTVFTLGRNGNCDIRADLADTALIERLDFSGFDTIVHCAGVTDEDFRRNAAQAWERSTFGFTRLTELAERARVHAFIYISTAHVYGKLEGRITEETPTNPLTDYALAHFAAEQIVKRSCGDGAMRGLVLRPCALYGVPMYLDRFDRWGLIPYAFPLDTVRDHCIVLRSHGEQQRNFISTADIANYIAKYLGCLENFAPFTVVNPVGAYCSSVFNLAQYCATLGTVVLDCDCQVVRPKPIGTLPPPLVYDSTHRYHQAADTMEDYLTTMITTLCQTMESSSKADAHGRLRVFSHAFLTQFSDEQRYALSPWRPTRTSIVLPSEREAT